MRKVIGIVIGVDAWIICGKLFHFVEPMFDGVEFWLIPEMPLARKICRIAVLLENSAMVGVLFVRPFSSPGTTTTESAERIGMRPVINEARPAVQLAWPYQLVKTGAFLGDLIDVRSRMAEVRAPP